MVEERPNLPKDLNNEDKERAEDLQQRFLNVQKQIDEIRQKTSSSIDAEQIITSTDLLIKHLREIEEQIRANVIQPINDYGRLIVDCQVKFCQSLEFLCRLLFFRIYYSRLFRGR